MSEIYVNLIVSNHSRVLENEILRVDTTFTTKDEYDTYRLAIDEWLADIPTPGAKKLTKEVEREIVIKTVVVNEATALAAKLTTILQPRDPENFPEFYVDSEADAAVIERRPYNGAVLEDV